MPSKLNISDCETQSHVREWGVGGHDMTISEQTAGPTLLKLSPLLCEVVPESLGTVSSPAPVPIALLYDCFSAYLFPTGWGAT